MERTELFSQACYKTLLKTQQKAQLRLRPQLTWKYIADKVRVQHTYISRSFSRAEVHLNEDHLFDVLDLLLFDDLEKDYLLLLRAKDLAASKARQAHLQERVDAMVKEHYVRVDTMKRSATTEEMTFLLEPLLLLIFVSLHVKKYALAPLQLARVYGLTDAQIEGHLLRLDQMNLISYDPKLNTVTEIKKNSMHFSKEHPLMRGHQQILRHLCASRIARMEDNEKLNFMASFSASGKAFAKIKEEFFKFVNEAQKHAREGEGERVYQMGFDLFSWD